MPGPDYRGGGGTSTARKYRKQKTKKREGTDSEGFITKGNRQHLWEGESRPSDFLTTMSKRLENQSEQSHSRSFKKDFAFEEG